MSHNDLTLPSLLSAFIGVDDLLLQARRFSEQDGFPRYNIERVDSHTYHLVFALAGYRPNDIKITLHNRTLSIEGGRIEDGDPKRFLHRGIANRAFNRSFLLDEHVKLTSATMEDGLLRVELVRELPPEHQPKQIEIQSR